MLDTSRVKIIHFITDEKFPDSAYEMFEKVLPGSNEFVLPDLTSPIKHLKKIKPIRAGKLSFYNPSFIRWVNGFDAIVVHGMGSYGIELINRCREDIKVYWIGMGFDYYDLIYSDKLDMLKEKTKEAFISHVKSSNSYGRLPIKFFRHFKNRLLYPFSSNKKNGIRRVDYFCPVLESEYHLVKEKLKDWGAEYVDWNYGNSAALVDGKRGESHSLGVNVLLGNSADPNNNHIDSLYFLKQHERFLHKDAKIFVPLSYGRHDWKGVVKSLGSRLFGDRFVPLERLLPLVEYEKIIESCGMVFMNHIRQQAGNNIASALYMGARVILDGRNPFYLDYKYKGVVMTSLQEVENNPQLLRSPLSLQAKVSNKYRLRELRGSSTAIHKTRVLIGTI